MAKKIVRKRSRCKGCPLDGAVQHKVYGQSDAERPEVVLLGEGPGREENERGMPFVGQAGWTFKGAVEETGHMWHAAHKTNVILCRPPGNKIDSPEGKEAQERCRAGLFEELYELWNRGTRVIVAAGATAMHALGIDGSIHKLRGSVFTMKWVEADLFLHGIEGVQILQETEESKHDVIVVPTFHPAYLLYDKDPKHEVTFLNDLEKAYDIAAGGYKPVRESFSLFPTIGELEDFTERMTNRKRKPLLAVDLETSGFVPGHAATIVVGIAVDGQKAISVPFLKQGGSQYWQNGERGRAISCLQRLLGECPTLYQNALFDCRHLLYLKIPAGRIEHDTMILHHCISPELPHNLGYIVSIYGKTPYWKGEVLASMKRMLDLPDEDLRTYNLRDAVVLHQVLQNMIAEAKEDGTYEVYEKIAMPLVEPVMQMIENGMLLDRKRLKKWKTSLRTKETKLRKKLREIAELPEAFKLDSGDHLRYLLFAKEPGQLVRAQKELKEYESNPRKKKGCAKHKEAIEIVETFKATKPFPRLRHTPRKTKSGSLSVDEAAMLNVQIAATNRIAQIDSLRRPRAEHKRERGGLVKVRDWIETYRKYSETEKLLTTYTNFPTDSDGRLRSPYRITGTNTGRLASGNRKAGEGGSVQNIPPEAKHIFTAPEGCTLVQLDYSNLELRVLAEISDDDVLRKTFAEGRNVHSENCKLLFGLTESDPMWKAARRACKTYIFGRNYGGGLKGIHERVAKAVPELNLTYNHFVEIDEQYRKAHPAYDAWYNKTVEEVKSTRCLRNAFGRVRYFLGRPYDIIKEGLNFPIQCLRFGTRVLTADLRWVSVENTREGDKLIGFDENLISTDGKGHRKWRYATVTHAERDVDYVYKITFDDEQVVFATGEHKWLCYPYNEKRNSYT